MNFFDIDRNGDCSEQEFMGQTAKAERLQQMNQAKRSGSPEKAGSFRGTVNSLNDSFNDRDVSDFAAQTPTSAKKTVI